MNLIYSIALLNIFFVVASSQEYVCPPDICERVDCRPPELMNCPAGIVPRGGRCGCCDSCAETCAMKLQKVQDRMAADEQSGQFRVGAPVPRCEPDGSHSPVQCTGAVCFCVNSTGHQLYRDHPENTDAFRDNIWEQHTMTCRCARDQHEFSLTGMVGRSFFCAQNGNYDSVGCRGTHCYCSDEYGEEEVGSPGAFIWEIESLNCED